MIFVKLSCKTAANTAFSHSYQITDYSCHRIFWQKRNSKSATYLCWEKRTFAAFPSLLKEIICPLFHEILLLLQLLDLQNKTPLEFFSAKDFDGILKGCSNLFNFHKKKSMCTYPLSQNNFPKIGIVLPAGLHWPILLEDNTWEWGSSARKVRSIFAFVSEKPFLFNYLYLFHSCRSFSNRTACLWFLWVCFPFDFKRIVCNWWSMMIHICSVMYHPMSQLFLKEGEKVICVCHHKLFRFLFS